MGGVTDFEDFIIWRADNIVSPPNQSMTIHTFSGSIMADFSGGEVRRMIEGVNKAMLRVDEKLAVADIIDLASESFPDVRGKCNSGLSKITVFVHPFPLFYLPLTSHAILSPTFA
jgi:hypothetical protein